jgi:3',5'-cyclic AMP phosphodiesterase CpdA
MPQSSTPISNPKHPFTDPRIRLLVIGDSGVGNATQRQVALQMDSYASKVLNQSPGSEFLALVHVGDLVYDKATGGGDPKYFNDRITQPYMSPLRARKFLVALGNHDANWVDNGEALLAFSNLSSRFYEQVFKSSDGVSMQLIVLDSNSLEYRPRINDSLTAQQALFLDSKLSEGSYTWRVVVFHHPVFSCSRHGSSMNVSAHWMPIIAQRGNVNLVLSGHDHK